MAVYVFLTDYLPNFSDSENNQQIKLRSSTDTIPVSGFNDSVTWGHSFTVSVSSNVFTSSQPASSTFIAYTVPIHNRSLTDTLTTKDIQNPQWPIHANFKTSFSIPISAFFVQVQEFDTPIEVNYVYAYSYPVSAYFTNSGVFDTRVLASLGSLSYNTRIFANFVNSSHKDFNAQIVIEPFNPPTLAYYILHQDFTANINIQSVDTFDTQIKVNYRVPPIDFDVGITARFAGNTYIYVTNLTTGEIFNAPVDVDGFWFVDGLIPGSYSIAPMLGGITFDPPIIYFTIVNANPTLYFTEVGVTDINNPFGD